MAKPPGQNGRRPGAVGPPREGLLHASQQLGRLAGHLNALRQKVHVQRDRLLLDRAVVVGRLARDVGVQVGAWNGMQGEIVVSN